VGEQKADEKEEKAPRRRPWWRPCSFPFLPPRTRARAPRSAPTLKLKHTRFCLRSPPSTFAVALPLPSVRPIGPPAHDGSM
jgi:hypothetical protein